MRLITKQYLANIVKDRWKAQYYTKGEWYAYGGDKEVKYNALVALGDNPSPDDVNKVIGNRAGQTFLALNVVKALVLL